MSLSAQGNPCNPVLAPCEEADSRARVWHAPMPFPRLGGGDVHVWQVSLDWPAAEVRRLEASLSEDEVLRANRFYTEQIRRRYVIGRGWLRALLSRYLGVSPEEVRFVYGAQGKPLLDDKWPHLEIRFNLSHSKQIAACAIGLDRDVGIDVEWIQPDLDFRHLAARFFTPAEKNLLHALPLEEGLTRFYAIWTCKEALLKAMGVGLSAPLDQINVSLASQHSDVVVSLPGDQRAARRWSVRRILIAPQYEAALAFEGAPAHITLLNWQVADGLE